MNHCRKYAGNQSLHGKYSSFVSVLPHLALYTVDKMKCDHTYCTWQLLIKHSHCHCHCHYITVHVVVAKMQFINVFFTQILNSTSVGPRIGVLCKWLSGCIYVGVWVCLCVREIKIEMSSVEFLNVVVCMNYAPSSCFMHGLRLCRGTSRSYSKWLSLK